jgi:hypothetical protein
MKQQLNDTCVYFHINKVKNQIFYVGIGNIKRPYDKLRPKYWHYMVNKYGYEIDIYKTGLTWEEACKLETEWIAKIGRRDKGLGPLINLTDGGDGTKGHIDSQEVKDRRNKSISALGPRSEETKEKLRLKMLGKTNAKGYKYTEQQKLDVSNRQLGKKRKPHSEKTKSKMKEAWLKRENKNANRIGKKHSEETKAKMAKKRRQYYINKNQK